MNHKWRTRLATTPEKLFPDQVDIVLGPSLISRDVVGANIPNGYMIPNKEYQHVWLS